MRIIALGDIHGRTTWKQIIANEKFDKVVFMGDYFDSHENISAEEQKENFKNILSYKRDNVDKVVLLFGNHDFHYLASAGETYSGYQKYHKFDIQELLQPAVDSNLIQMCFKWENILFSHAGITRTWCKNNLIQEAFIEESVNDLFKYKPIAFRFTSGPNRSPYGDDIEQTPIWVRPQSLLRDRIRGYIQVVGHTIQERLITTHNIILIDTLGTSGEYLIWDNFQFSVGKTTS